MSDDSSVLGLKICLQQELAAGLIFMMLNDDSSVIRQHAIGFAKTFEQVLQSSDYDENVIKCFETTNQKPSPTKKSTPEKFAPLEISVTSSILKTLLKVRIELIQDKNQLSTTICKIKNQEIFERLVRSLSDYPTFTIKSKLVSVLSLVPQ